MLLSIVTPVFNEEEILNNFIGKLSRLLNSQNIDYELILVENGSTDKTLSLIREKVKENPRIKLFHLPKPSYGLSLKYGLKKAKGDYVIVFNVDFWDPEFIKIATEQDLRGADIIVGSKNLPQSKDERPLGRKLITRGLALFLKIFLGFKGTDTHGIKIFRKQALTGLLPRRKVRGGLFDSELLVRAQRAHLKILEVPVIVKEIRPPRFKGRFLSTPKDLCELFLALR